MLEEISTISKQQREIPDEWNALSLRSLCLKTTMTDPTRNPELPFVYVDVSAISNELWKITTTTRHTGATAPSRARKLVQPRDVIFATVRPTLKRVALVPNDLHGQIVSTAFCVLRADPVKADPHFLYYSLLTDDFIAQMENLQRGASYPAVADSDVLEQEIPVPSLPEQRAIAAVLAKIQAAVEVQDKIVAMLKELKAATMSKLFREGVVKGYMFDSNIFDAFVDGTIDLDSLRKGLTIYVTHIQQDEINSCSDDVRRHNLQKVLIVVSEEELPTESFILGVSRLGCARLGDGSLLEELRGTSFKNTNDALIAETAIKNGLVLVTNDKNLRAKVKKVGGESITSEDLLAGRLRPMKRTELVEIPESWEAVEFEACLDPQARYEVGKLQTNAYGSDGHYPIIDQGQSPIAGYTNDESLAYRGPLPVVIFGDHTRVFKFISEPFVIGADGTKILHPNNRVDERFFYYALTRLLIPSRGYNRHYKLLREERIPVPTRMEEQQLIAQVIKQIDDRLTMATVRRDKIQSLFSSMLHLLMTGRVRVTESIYTMVKEARNG